MSISLDRYRELEASLALQRLKVRGFSSPEEDRILDQMDAVWWQLEEAEREMLNSEPPGTLIQ